MRCDDKDNDSDNYDSVMKMMNSFILIFYLKVAICIQHVFYLIVIKSISSYFGIFTRFEFSSAQKYHKI